MKDGFGHPVERVTEEEQKTKSGKSLYFMGEVGKERTKKETEKCYLQFRTMGLRMRGGGD